MEVQFVLIQQHVNLIYFNHHITNASVDSDTMALIVNFLQQLPVESLQHQTSILVPT